MDVFDLIGPVMIGPSSSHTAGAARIGLTARLLLGEQVAEADVGLHGSFAHTYHGHGTDRAITGGLMGMAVDDTDLRNSLEKAEQAGMKLCFHAVHIRGAHPNTVQLKLVGVSGRHLELEAASVGGGSIVITRLNSIAVSFSGKENTLIIHQEDTPGIIANVTSSLASQKLNIANMQVYRRSAGSDAMMVLELDGMPETYTLEHIRAMDGIIGVTFLKRRKA